MDGREDFAYYTNKQPAACDAGYVLSICYFVINALITIDSVKNKKMLTLFSMSVRSLSHAWQNALHADKP